MKLKLALLTIVLLITVACVPPPRHSRRYPQAPAPCTPAVAPIHDVSGIVVVVNVNASYTPKDLPSARTYTQGDVLAYLNELGVGDRNTFVSQNGNQANFHYTYTINNDGQEHYTWSLEMSGWGAGYIHTFNTAYSYTDAGQMFRDLTAQSYAFIHGGWHDARPSCPQN